MTVVTATLRPEGTGWVPRWLNEAARRHQGSLAEGLRHGRHVPAPGSGPDLPREAPGLVADEVLRVLSLAPRGGAQRSAAATRVWHPEQVVISRP